MKYNIFISYSRKDAELANKVCAVMDEYKRYYNFEYFFDKSDIISRNEYIKKIAESIDNSSAVLFLASQSAYASEFCIKELLFADKRGVHIHQYRIDRAELPIDLDMLLGTHQYRELHTTSIEDEVREVLSDVLGRDVLPLSELNPSTKESNSCDVASTSVAQSAKHLSKRTHKSLWIALALVLALVGVSAAVYKCYDTGLRADEGYKVGDIYDQDGKRGVVFEVSDDGNHGKIVSLEATQTQWTTFEQFQKSVAVGARSFVDGKLNTDIVMAREDSDCYPAHTWCRSMGEDWYLPAIYELEALLCNADVRNAVNATLRKLGAETLHDIGWAAWYWSSTEYETNPEDYARLFRTHDGFVNFGYKHLTRVQGDPYVRAVATF